MEDKQQVRAETERDADPRIELAVERTLLAIERTQLAWEKNGHFAGLLLTLGGTFLMALATIIFILRIRELNHIRGLKGKFPPPGVLISIFIFLVGSLAIYSLTFSW